MLLAVLSAGVADHATAWHVGTHVVPLVRQREAASHNTHTSHTPASDRKTFKLGRQAHGSYSDN